MVKTDNPFVLAIDLGSGGPKVGLVGLDGKVVASGFRRTSVILLPDGGAEQDPSEWWSSVSETARQVILEAGVSPEEIIAVSVTSQWSVVVPVNERGDPVMNAVHWMDTRGGHHNRELMKGFPSVSGYYIPRLLKYLKKAGMPPTISGMDSVGHMLFIKNERQEVYQRTYKFLEPMDYLNLKLTGKFSATQNTVFAFISTDNRRLGQTKYDPDLVAMNGIPQEKLPDLLPVDAILGTLTPAAAEELGLLPSTIVIAANNDNSTSAIGAGAISDHDAAAVLGSSGYLAFHIPKMIGDVVHMMTSMPSALPGRYLAMVEMGNNGKVLDSYLNNLVYAKESTDIYELPDNIYERANQLAAMAPPGSEGVIFMPWYNGSLAPHEAPHMRGGILNLSHKSNRTHITRAVFEGMSYNWRWLIQSAEKVFHCKFKSLRLTGGGALSEIWCQIMADVLGIPMHQQADPRMSNVLGAAFLAFNRLGLISLEEIPARIPFNRTYEPRPETAALYEHMFQQYLACHKNLASIYKALNHS